ncbi:MAG: hypothetical protein C5B59_08710 [Bacteroidetes bacterium]|nr:MAG: hypothetical protein C5B59_08710 [Bacteroidota bacterium]
MTDPTKGNIYSADIDIILDDRERSILAGLLQQESFDILQKIMEDVVRKQNRILINTDPSDPFHREVAAQRQLVAYAVGRFYIDLVTRLKSEFEIEKYRQDGTGTMSNPENPNSEDFK